MLAVFLGLIAASACQRKVCKEVAVDGLSVGVVGPSGATLCDVKVEIRDGAYVETKALIPSNCTFSGASERPGTYTIRVSREGNVVATETVVLVSDECHVKRAAVTLTVE